MQQKRTQQSGDREKKWEQAQEVEVELLGGARPTLDAAEMTMSMTAGKGSQQY